MMDLFKCKFKVYFSSDFQFWFALNINVFIIQIIYIDEEPGSWTVMISTSENKYNCVGGNIYLRQN